MKQGSNKQIMRSNFQNDMAKAPPQDKTKDQNIANSMPKDGPGLKASDTVVVENTRKMCYKFLAAGPLVASIMGPKGKIIQDIQNESNTFIKITDRGCHYPGTASRLATIFGSRSEDLQKTLGKVIKHLNECIGERQQQNNPPPDLSEICPTGNIEAMILTLIVPRNMRGVVIGPGGAQVTGLRQMSGCKIKLDDGLPGDTIVKIEGKLEGIRKVAEWIIDEVQNMCEDFTFREWAYGNQNGTRNSEFGGQMMDGDLKMTHPDGLQHVQLPPPDMPLNEICNLMTNLAKDFDPQGEHHAMNVIQISLPINFKGPLVGKNGLSVKEILLQSHCKTLNIQDIEGTQDCCVTLEGSVLANTIGYMLIMRKYNAFQKACFKQIRCNQSSDRSLSVNAINSLQGSNVISSNHNNGKGQNHHTQHNGNMNNNGKSSSSRNSTNTNNSTGKNMSTMHGNNM